MNLNEGIRRRRNYHQTNSWDEYSKEQSMLCGLLESRPAVKDVNMIRLFINLNRLYEIWINLNLNVMTSF